ncbi:alkylation response protein AidB-like acyl-CoA dehydrogenase [Mycolicibacterium fluoranthenivorans]|uniref:Alkylation response protein AidB-like acyl-CoA dehydrogenase n=1 Tax=Mycolicibacterium fluoranthenivorans TaxID=258505 RepID=A0A7X5ZEP5_9MYCO|nr:alkylation response protein AidB-like acyl-CoA dehydrogenase [Mycolicibacterium fluoranthenivorans]
MSSADDVDLDLLRKSARDFLTGRGHQDSVDDLARLDWIGLLAPEKFGGSGWLPVESVVVAEELGRSGDGSAWLGTLVAAAAVSAAPDDIRNGRLEALLSGAATAGVAIADDEVRVIRGDEVDLVVTLGRNGVHLIELSDSMVTHPDEDLLDVVRPVWRVDISSAPGMLIGSAELAGRLVDTARLLLAADSVGALSMTVERLTSYLKEREAFGAPIASFQAIQHRLVELLVLEVKARAAIMKAARAAATGDGSSARLSTVAHAFVTAKAAAAVDECMQLSGGIGFTWEYPLHHELRRVFTNAHLLGTAAGSRTHLAEVSGW